MALSHPLGTSRFCKPIIDSFIEDSSDHSLLVYVEVELNIELNVV